MLQRRRRKRMNSLNIESGEGGGRTNDRNLGLFCSKIAEQHRNKNRFKILGTGTEQAKLEQGYYSVLAKQPIPTGNVGIFYFEVKVISKKGFIFIGLGTKSMPLNGWPGHYKGTYAYGDGEFWGHDVAGCFYYGTSRLPYIIN
uniref:B30.2/SPRY domain-containing protein n=1 Tax=Globodera rostochiensis TaxID=31243 RepID=A0A914HJ16_GLORO